MDNYFWPAVTPNDLLATDLPGRTHLLEHFIDDPQRVPAPQSVAWREKHDRAKEFRDLRDGTILERRRAVFVKAWAYAGDEMDKVANLLDLTRQDLDDEGLAVLTELLHDNSFSHLEVSRHLPFSFLRGIGAFPFFATGRAWTFAAKASFVP